MMRSERGPRTQFGQPLLRPFQGGDGGREPGLVKCVVQPQHKLALLDGLAFRDGDLDDGFVGFGHQFDPVALQRAYGGQGRVGVVAARRHCRRQYANQCETVFGVVRTRRCGNTRTHARYPHTANHLVADLLRRLREAADTHKGGDGIH